jgi:hypothetical protein
MLLCGRAKGDAMGRSVDTDLAPDHCQLRSLSGVHWLTRRPASFIAFQIGARAPTTAELFRQSQRVTRVILPL